MQFEINGSIRNVIVHHKRMKNMVLRIDESGNLCVNCPAYITEEQIQRFLNSKKTWILNAERHQNRKQSEMKCGVDGQVCWLGKTYPAYIENGGIDSVKFDGNRFLFTIKEISDTNIQNLFYRFAGKYMAEKIADLRQNLDDKICRENGKPMPHITMKYMISRWGSCTPAKSRISMSVRLIHYPMECMEYVLIHEYAHILVPNHSSSFYTVVRKYMPNYKYYSDLLNH